MPQAEMSEGSGPTADDIRRAEQEVDMASHRTLDALQRWLAADNATLARSLAWLEETRRAETVARDRLHELKASAAPEAMALD